MTNLKLGNKSVGAEHPDIFYGGYFGESRWRPGTRQAADPALCAGAGADAAKFQNFRAPKIVSERGFRSLGDQLSHQAKWKKSVFQVYRDASLPWEWTAGAEAAMRSLAESNIFRRPTIWKPWICSTPT